VLAGTSPDLIRIDAAEHSQRLATALLSAPASSELNVAFDPMATLAVEGDVAWDYDSSAAAASELATLMDTTSRTGTVICADARPWHAAGASEVQELAVALRA